MYTSRYYSGIPSSVFELQRNIQFLREKNGLYMRHGGAEAKSIGFLTTDFLKLAGVEGVNCLLYTITSQHKQASSTLFISNTFISNARLKLAKDQANAKQHPETELLLYENYSLSSSSLSSKNNSRYLHNVQKTSTSV